MQLRPLKSEGMLPFKGGAGAWKPDQRCCGEPAPPTGSKVHVRWPGGERAQLTFQRWRSVANTTVWESGSVGTCGWRTVLHCASRPGPWLKRDRGSQFVPRLASWVSWKGLAPTSKPGCCSTRVVHTGCFFFFLFLRRCSSSSSPALDKSKIFCLKFYFVFFLFMFEGGKDSFFFISGG